MCLPFIMWQQVQRLLTGKRAEKTASVRLSSIEKWLEGQVQDELRVQANMLKTVYDGLQQTLDIVDEVLTEFAHRPLRTEDFPDAPPSVQREKKEAVDDLYTHFNEIKKVTDQMTHDIHSYRDATAIMVQHITAMQKILDDDTLKRYFSLPIKTVHDAVHALQEFTRNAHDVLTGRVIQELYDVAVHVDQVEQKMKKRSDLHTHIQGYQKQLDEKYKEYLRLEAKINDIKSSKRFNLEQKHPREQRGSPIGHFSVLEQEIKELQSRKKHIDIALQGIKQQRDAIQRQYDALAVERHIQCIKDIVFKRTKITVDVIYDDV